MSVCLLDVHVLLALAWPPDSVLRDAVAMIAA
jgi:hypothetical protein